MGVLYSSLLDRAQAAGATWLSMTSFTGLELGPSVVTLHLKQAGESLSLQARYVVAADGATSRVAPALGLEENKRWIVGAETVRPSALREAEPHFDLTVDAKLAPGYLAWVVDDGHERHIGVAGAGRRYKPAEQLRNYEKQLMVAEDVPIIERRGGRIPVGGILGNISNEYGLAVGDAAGAVSPLTAGGLDPCLRLSRLAADVIIGRLLHEEPNAHHRYNGKHFRGRFSTRLILRRVLETARSNALVNLGMWLLRTPPGRRFASKLFFGRGSFPDVDLKYLSQPGDS
jgi:flavin-dependent dehydrogenase